MKPVLAEPNTLAAQMPLRGPVTLVALVRDKSGAIRYTSVGAASPKAQLIR